MPGTSKPSLIYRMRWSRSFAYAWFTCKTIFRGIHRMGSVLWGGTLLKVCFQQVALLTECHSSSKRFAGGCLSQAFPMHRLRGPIARYCAAYSRGYLKTGNQSPRARSSQSSSVQASQAGHCEKDCQPSWPVLKTKIMTAFPAESIVGFPAVSRIASPVPVCKIAGFPTVSNSPSLLWQISLWDARTKDQSKTEAVDR